MKNYSITAFIKAIDSQYADAFINKGEIYLNTLQWFRYYEKDNNIGDHFEGADAVCGNGMKLYYAPIGEYDKFQLLTDKLENFQIYNTKTNGNILSLYAILEQPSDIHDVKLKFIDEFSHHRFFLITAPSLFLDKIRNALQPEIRDNIRRDLVKYYKLTDEYTEISDFQTRETYEYQKEFRLFIPDPNATPLTLYIGDLHEIAFEIDLKNKMYRIESSEGIKIIKVED